MTPSEGRATTSEGSVPTNVEVVTFALAELDGAAHPVHLEEIAEKAHQLLPGAFRWDLDRFAGYIDKDKVRVSLTDAQKEKYGRLVRAEGVRRGGLSKTTDAWRLTPAGTAWYVENGDRVARSLGASRPALKRGRASEIRSQLMRSELYKVFLTSGAVPEDAFAFADLVECSPDASGAVVARRFEALVNQAQLLDDASLVTFLQLAGEANRDMMHH